MYEKLLLQKLKIVGTAWWIVPENVRSSLYDNGANVCSLWIIANEYRSGCPGFSAWNQRSIWTSSVPMLHIRDSEDRACGPWIMWAYINGCLTIDREFWYTIPKMLLHVPEHSFLSKVCTLTQSANMFRMVVSCKNRATLSVARHSVDYTKAPRDATRDPNTAPTASRKNH